MLVSNINEKPILSCREKNNVIKDIYSSYSTSSAHDTSKSNGTRRN
jgi:hypothetical protein